MPQMSKSGMIVEFKYNHNGLRVGKVVNGVETKYTRMQDAPKNCVN